MLIQRGKGGGLAGALGGMGGQSAFGTKAGDLFTKITVGVAAFWIVLCMITVRAIGTGTGPEGPLDKSKGVRRRLRPRRKRPAARPHRLALRPPQAPASPAPQK